MKFGVVVFPGSNCDADCFHVLGMMPHPERCTEEILNNTDGRLLFESLLKWQQEGRSR